MTQADTLVTQIEELSTKLDQARSMIRQIFIGQDRVVDLVLTTLLCGGHGILVGLPGLGKTRLVEALSTVMGLHGNRVQFTPDLMPADILGSEVLETAADGSRSFRFIQGPVFCQLLMADEINRASPRTQSALLQAMQEKHVTVAGVRYDLPAPFHVLATQNPIEQEGTYPLPEAQLDRFLLKVDVTYPDLDTERRILIETTGSDEQTVQTALNAQQLIDLQNLVRQMPVGESVLNAILTLIRDARPEQSSDDRVRRFVDWGPSPRAGQALMLACRARALLRGRLAPSIEDVEALAEPCLAHRMGMRYDPTGEAPELDMLIGDLISKAA